MKKWCLVLVLMLPALSQAQPNLIGRDVMPFGGCTNWSAFYHPESMPFFDSVMVDTLKNVFGINQMKLGVVYDTTAQRWARRGIYTYPSGYNWLGGNSYSVEPQSKYSQTTYFVCQPESAYVYATKFNYINGQPSGDYVVCNSPGIALNNLSLNLSNRNTALDPSNPLEYSPFFKMALDSSITDTGIPIGTFRVFRENINDPIFVANIRSGNIINGGGDWLPLQDSLTNLEYFRICSAPFADSSKWVRFQFEISDSCTSTVYVDAFKVQDQFGALLANGDITTTNQIKSSVSRPGYKGKILGWFIKDTPYPNNYRPIGIIDSLTQAAMNDSNWVDSLKVRTASWLCTPENGISYKEFARIAKTAEVIFNQTARRTVDRIGAYEVVVSRQQSEKHRAHGAHSRTGGDTTIPVFQLGHIVLKNADCRIPNPRVNVSVLFPGKERRAMGGILEGKCRCLINGNIYCSGRVPVEPGMYQFCIKTRFLCIHSNSLMIKYYVSCRGGHRMNFASAQANMQSF